MFEVLVYVYENYWRGDACPEWEHLKRKLNAAGFESHEIQEALTWLNGLNMVTKSSQIEESGPGVGRNQNVGRLPPFQSPATTTPGNQSLQSSTGIRVYAAAEQDHLSCECLGFLTFLESAGVLSAGMREIVIDRAMAAPGKPVSLDDLKIIILMVYWGFGEEPDVLVLDELCAPTDRVAH
ncbi:MAG: hypothetical protein RL211_1879 [Pseudomonadota bacterium]|jgi:Smg protein